MNGKVTLDDYVQIASDDYIGYDRPLHRLNRDNDKYNARKQKLPDSCWLCTRFGICNGKFKCKKASL